MTRVLLGALVVSLLTLTGLVTYHSFTWSDNPAVTGPAPTEGVNSCRGHKPVYPVLSADGATAAGASCCDEAAPKSACCGSESAAKKSACCEDAAPAAVGVKKE
jgi:hypothetical protein